jgi:hypothetical protein
MITRISLNTASEKLQKWFKKIYDSGIYGELPEQEVGSAQSLWNDYISFCRKNKKSFLDSWLVWVNDIEVFL